MQFLDCKHSRVHDSLHEIHSTVPAGKYTLYSEGVTSEQTGNDIMAPVKMLNGVLHIIAKNVFQNSIFFRWQHKESEEWCNEVLWMAELQTE